MELPKTATMRGLNVFITDIRNCRSREEEEKRVNKEMANIRAKFKEGKLTSYDKKKYVCKMLYMYILGWDIDFGHVEAVNLITGNKYSEKQIGYLAITLMLSENTDMIRIVVNSMKNDLANFNEVFNCLALAAIANIGGREMAESLHGDVFRLLTVDNGNTFVKKKAALCLLRLFRKSPETLPALDWAKTLIPLIDDADLGVSSAVVTLITTLSQQYPNEYAGSVAKVIDKMDQLLQGNVRSDYEYYRIPAPWLQVKCLRLLQCYPPPENQSQLNAMNSIINRVIAKAQENTKPGNFANAMNAIILEAVNLAIHIDPDSEIVKKAVSLLGSFVTHKETNFRYLGLESLANAALAVESLDSIKRHTAAVLQALRDRDISVRRRGLDLLYCMCDSSNSHMLVEELLQYLAIADFGIREELVLKIAILAERFATDYGWYVDVILKLIANAGDYIPDDVWYRVIQIVLNNPDLQKYAAGNVLKALRSPSWHETAVKVGAYILGEFGDLIVEEPLSAPADQFLALHSKFGACSPFTKALLFTSYLKLANLFPEIKEEVANVFRQYADVLDSEMQQRACEYLAILQAPNPALLEQVCEEIPPFPEKEESPLVSLVEKKNTDKTDKALRLRAHKGGQKITQRLGSFSLPKEREGSSDSSSSPSRRSFSRGAAAAAAAAAATGTFAPAPVAAAAAAAPPASSNPLDDLLGLGLGPAAPVAQTPASVFDPLGFGAPAPAPAPAAASLDDSSMTPGGEKGFNKLLHSNDGVLFEDASLQIGVKSEFRGASGRLSLYFGNKTPAPLEAFTSGVSSSPALRIQGQTAPGVIAGQAQVQQMFQIDCAAEFAVPPTLTITFRTGGTPRRLNLPFPVVVTKFIDPIQLGGDDFFGRWKQIGGPPKEVVKDIKLQGGWELGTIRSVLNGMRLNCLDGIDPNPANFVCAGIFMTASAKIGCLLRIQTSAADKAIRVTARTTNPAVSEIVVDLVVKKLSQL